MIEELDLKNPEHLNRLKVFSRLEHPESFRYFKNRVFEEAVKTHKLTLLYSYDKKDVAYAHIDFDILSDRSFLGICVLPEYQSKGIGKTLIEHLLKNFQGNLYLTVDNNNTRAISLYKKFDFKLFEEYSKSGLWQRLL
jgi:ribosomal protein S18 acetylase RimI-like enzyme